MYIAKIKWWKKMTLKEKTLFFPSNYNIISLHHYLKKTHYTESQTNIKRSHIQWSYENIIKFCFKKNPHFVIEE